MLVKYELNAHTSLMLEKEATPFSMLKVPAGQAIKLITLADAEDADWQTALALKIKPIPKGTVLDLIGITRNLYGCFCRVKYNSINYDIAINKVEVYNA